METEENRSKVLERAKRHVSLTCFIIIVITLYSFSYRSCGKQPHHYFFYFFFSNDDQINVFLKGSY